MWEPQPLTNLRASKACRGENFTFTFRALVSPSLAKKKMTRMDQIITVSAFNLRFWFKVLVVLLVKRLADFKVTEPSK
jgi:hypothetical protein